MWTIKLRNKKSETEMGCCYPATDNLDSLFPVLARFNTAKLPAHYSYVIRRAA